VLQKVVPASTSWLVVFFLDFLLHHHECQNPGSIIASNKSWASSLNGGMSVVSEWPIDLQDHHKPVAISNI